MAISNETLAVALGLAKKYTDFMISQLPKGVVLVGTVDYYNDLPNNAEVGDAYTVRYKGTSGTTPSGAEYAWTQSGVWLFLGPDMSQYQETLVSGENIKTINGTSVLGSGDIVTPDTASGFTEETWTFTLSNNTTVTKKILVK